MKPALLIPWLFAPLPALAGYEEQVQTNRPVAYWRLTEPTPPPVPSTAINWGTEGARLNGTYLGGVALGQPGAIPNSTDTSAFFSPSAGQHAEISNHPALNDAFTVTIEFWAMVTGGTGLRCPVSSLQVNGPNRFGYVFYVDEAGRWQFRTGRGSLSEGFNVVTGPAARIGEWTHVVGVYESAGTTAANRLYINGQLAGSLNGRAEMNQTNPQRLGASSGAFGVPTDFFPGGLDEVAIYRRALPASEVWAHFSAGANYAAFVMNSQPRGYWRLNEPPPAAPTVAVNLGSLGSTANGQYLNGTQGGRPGALLTAPTNTAAAFDGADDKIEVPFLPALNCPTFTVECWANPTFGGPPGGEAVSSRDLEDTLSARGWALGKDGADRWRFWLGTGSAGPALLPGPTVRNQWEHLVASYDGVFARLYVDATLVAIQRTNFLPNTARPLRIGAGGNELALGSAFLRGDVDEVAIYTNALADGDVLDHFLAAGRPAPKPVGPTIVENPVSATNYVGATVTFSVAAAGSLPLRYQWQRNGVDLPGANTSSLILTNLTLLQAGSYRARVFNDAATAVSFEAVLTVEPEGWPVILEPPRPTTNYAGGTARFSVVATGGTNLLYQWQRNGADLAQATNAALSIPNLQLTNAGSYRVRVATSRGTTFSEAAWLMVEVPPPDSYPAAVMTDRPLAYWRLGERTGLVARDASSGYHAEVYSNVGLGQPGALAGDPDTAFWYTAGYFSWVEAPPELPVLAAPFSVEAWARLADAPNTHRTLVGSLARQPSRGFRLEVSPTGRWEFALADPAGVSVVSGLPATRGAWAHVVGTWDGAVQRLFVNGAQVGHATATYLPATGWPVRLGADSFDGGAGLIGDAFFDGDLDEVALYDHPLSPDRVVAHYGAGVGRLLPPAILESPDSLAAFPGYTVTFQVLASGSPPLAYQWQFNGADLTGQTNATLTLADVTQANAGNYRVRVGNALGARFSDAASLTIVTLPDTSYADAVRAAGAASYWRLGETNGVTALDAAGGRPGTYLSGVVLGITGVDSNNPAAHFVRAGASRVEVPFSPALNPPRFSVEVWARVTGGAATQRAAVTSRVDGPQRGYALVASPANRWRFLTGRGDLSGWDAADGPEIEPEAWTHLVGTFDGQTKRLYVNGRLAGKSGGPFAVNDLRPLSIGGDQLTSPEPAAYFEGDLDEVAVYPRPLTPEEILTHYGLITRTTQPPTLSISRQGSQVVLTWANGTLESAGSVVGPWGEENASSPLLLQPTLAARFYRVRQ
jgi:hypothetical protein